MPDLRSIRNVFKQIVMVVAGVVILYPMFFVLLTSFKSNADIITHPFLFTKFFPENYVEAWKLGRVAEYLMNSVYVTLITLVLQTIIIVLAGYAFGKLKPRGHNTLLVLYLSALFVTSEMTTVPVFILLKDIGLINTLWGLIFPYTASGLVLGVYIVKNFINDLPKEMDEAAIVDGASLYDTMVKIDLPLISPVIATILIINFQGVWSEFYWALIAIKDESLKTLPLGLINFQSQYGSDFGVLSAGLCILTAPVLAVYMFASRFFIEGISAGAVKG